MGLTPDLACSIDDIGVEEGRGRNAGRKEQA